MSSLEIDPSAALEIALATPEVSVILEGIFRLIPKSIAAAKGSQLGHA